MQKFLAWFANALRGFEDLLAHASTPVLAGGLALGVVDLITGSHLFSTHPLLQNTWAVTQAVGIEVMLPMMADRIVMSWQKRQFGATLFYLLMTGALGYIAFLGGMVVSLEQTEGVDAVQAMAQMGITPIEWLFMRNGLAVVMVVLAGVLRIKPEVKSVAQLEQEMAEGDTRARYNAWKRQQAVRNARGLLNAARAVATGKEVQEEVPAAVQEELPSEGTPPIPIGAARKKGSEQDRMRKMFTPGMSPAALAKLAGVHRNTAARFIAAQRSA